MEYEIVELEEKIVEGIGVWTSNQDGQSMQDIGVLWQKFLMEGTIQKIENRVNEKTIGLYTDYESDYTKPYYFMTCCEVHQKPKTATFKVIPKGKYAKFVITGDVQKAVGEAWEKIWKMDLKRKYSCDFEEYQNHTTDMQNQEIHIYIAMED